MIYIIIKNSAKLLGISRVWINNILKYINIAMKME